MDALANSFAIFANDWLAWVGHAAWQGAIVGLVALAVVRLGRRWPAPLRYWIVVLALFKFAMPPLTSLPTGVFSLVSVSDSHVPTIDRRTAFRSSATRGQPLTPPDHGLGTSSIAKSSADLSVQPAGASVDKAAGSSVPPIAKAPAASSLSRFRPGWQTVFILVYLSGTTVVLASFVIRAFRLRSSWRRMELPDRELAASVQSIARQLELRRIPALRISRDVQVPFSAGVLCPIIVLPRRSVHELPSEEVRAILSHELAHHRRGDLWLNLIQVLMGAAWWFHPIVWLLNRAIRNLREDCCDDLLLSRRLVTDESYCTTLLHVARAGIPRQASSPVCVSITDGLHPLAGRIKRIMDENLPRPERPGTKAIVALLALAAVVLPGVRAAPAPAPGVAVLKSPHSRPQMEANQQQPHAQSDEAPLGDAKGRLLESKRVQTLRQDALVFGRVTDAEGRPVVAATVAIGQYFDNFGSPATSKTDDEAADIGTLHVGYANAPVK